MEWHLSDFKNRRLQMFLKIDILKNFAIFTEKKYVLKSLYNKVAGPATFLNRNRCFPVNVAKVLRTAFFIEHL